MRVRRGTKRVARRRKILKLASGYYGQKSRSHRVAKLAVDRSLQFAYRDRRQRKREFRKLWIVRINAASRQNGLPYSRLIAGLKKAEIEVNRKILADIAVNDEDGFRALAEAAKQALGA